MADSDAEQVPPWPSNVGQTRTVDAIDGTPMTFTIMDEILRPQQGFAGKLLCLQRLKFSDGTIELRLAYYILGWKPSRRGRWVWGQYATFLPPEDFKGITDEARTRGWF